MYLTLASVTEDLCGSSCDAGETILGVVLIICIAAFLISLNR